MMPKISITIPCFNRPDLLLLALNSIKKQTTKPHEVIVIDNASTDNMNDVVSFCKKNKYKYLRNKVNLGMGENWNKCIRKASGDYLCILHSDDILYENWHKEFSKYIYKNMNADVFCCALSLIDILNKITSVYFPLKSTGLLIDNFKEIFESNYNALAISGAMVIKKSAFKKVGLFNADFGTECDVWFYNTLMKKCKIFYINKILFGYRVHNLQAMDKKIEENTASAKIKRTINALFIVKLFYKNELNSDINMRYFYRNHALVGYIMAIKYFLLIDFRSASKLRHSLKKYFPDILSIPSDYLKLIQIIFIFIYRIIENKILLTYSSRTNRIQ